MRSVRASVFNATPMKPRNLFSSPIHLMRFSIHISGLPLIRKAAYRPGQEVPRATPRTQTQPTALSDHRSPSHDVSQHEHQIGYPGSPTADYHDILSTATDILRNKVHRVKTLKSILRVGQPGRRDRDLPFLSPPTPSRAELTASFKPDGVPFNPPAGRTEARGSTSERRYHGQRFRCSASASNGPTGGSRIA